MQTNFSVLWTNYIIYWDTIVQKEASEIITTSINFIH